MAYALQQLRALIEAHPDRAASLLRPVEALEAAILSEPEVCLYRVRTLFEVVHASIAPVLGIALGGDEFPKRNSRLLQALDLSVPGHPEAAKIDATLKRLLGAINSTASALAELSNIPNLRHGGSLDWPTLGRQHAAMLGSLCDALVAFLFDVAWSREPTVSLAPDRYEDYADFNAASDDENEPVLVAGSTFEPSRVLFALDRTQYDVAIGDWAIGEREFDDEAAAA